MGNVETIRSAYAETRSQLLRSGDMPAGNARIHAFPAQLRSQVVTKGGKDFFQVEGYASVFERGYQMYDMCGPYDEIMDSRAFDKTLAAKPDVAFLCNHKGVTMARTTNGSLELFKDSTGLGSRAMLNMDRQDVRDLMSAIDDGLVDEMSFAFMLNDGSWNDDFTEFTITEADIDRGDVSAVNYGANPYTSIQARTTEFIDLAQRVPLSVARAAVEAMSSRDGFSPDTSATDPTNQTINFGNSTSNNDVDVNQAGVDCPSCGAAQAVSPKTCSNCGDANVTDPSNTGSWPTDVQDDSGSNGMLADAKPAKTREQLADAIADDLADIANWEVVDETGTDHAGNKLTIDPTVTLPEPADTEETRGSMSISMGTDNPDDATADDAAADFVAGADACLDAAAALLEGTDLTTLPANVQQAILLFQNAGQTVDAVMDSMGIDDPDDGTNSLSETNKTTRETSAVEADSETDETLSNGTAVSLVRAKLAALDL